MRVIRRWVLAGALLASGPALADDDVSTNSAALPPGGAPFTLAALAGWDWNTFDTVNPLTRRTTSRSDVGGEYALMATYATPRLNINDIFFYTDPNDSDVKGNILSAAVSGDPAARLTWAVGGSYTWHKVDMPSIAIRIDEPLLRAGPLFRFPAWHVSVNPYAGYARLAVDTSHGDDAWDTGIYGVLGRWDWRMLHLAAQYYLQDNQARGEQYHVLRARLAVLLTPNWGFLLRGEHMKQYTTEDTSLLLGPVYRF